MHKRALAVGVVLVMILLTMGSPGWAAPQSQARSVITYPTDGMTISGVVEVAGIATHPNILWYEVDYAYGVEPTGESQWIPLTYVENAQVEDGVLVIWDTTGVPDGSYCLALTIKGRDDPIYYQQFVKRLTVNNAQPVETPAPETPTPEPMPTAVVGPTPTPVSVEQPATPTPRPSPTPSEREGGEVTAPVADDGEQAGLALNADALRNAFCDGVWTIVLLFALWGLYLLAKAGVRWFLRRQYMNPPE